MLRSFSKLFRSIILQPKHYGQFCSSSDTSDITKKGNTEDDELKIIDNTLEVTSEEIWDKYVVRADRPVIVNFHADWCIECHFLTPKLKKTINDKCAGKILLALVNVDHFPDFAINYGIEILPAVLAMKAGVKLDSFHGIKNDKEVDEFFEKVCQLAKID